MSLAGREIVVIGAGIAGLAAATALAQRRAKVCVLEKAPALTEVGAGLQLGPNGVAVLEALGLRDAAECCAELPEAIELRDHATERCVARLPLGPQCVSRYGRPYWHIHRADLIAVLSEGARAAGVDLRLGDGADTMIRSPDGQRVVTHGGTDHAAECVIAADGLRSGIRAQHFAGTPPRFTGNVAWRGVVRTGDLPPGLLPPTACVFMGPGRHLVTYPLRGGALRNFVAVEERTRWAAEGWSEPDDPDTLRAAFRGWGPSVTGLLAAVERTFLWGLFDHPPLPAWVNGRIVLVGDACHPTLPFLAQGAAMALEDAWILAAELDASRDIETGLHAFEARRKRRTSRVQRASARNGRIFHLGPGISGIAHLGLSAASAMMPGAFMSRFDWLYGADIPSADATR